MPDRAEPTVRFDELYSTMPAERIPWHHDTPPEQLVALVEGGRLGRGRALDLGCGLGVHARYLARQGFEVTGMDISPFAVERARQQAAAEGLGCAFVAAELPEGLAELDGAFDLAWEWEVLHHVFPEDRPSYLDAVRAGLRPGGLYASTCFSEEDPSFGVTDKYRKTPLGTVIYFSSEGELRALFEPRFEVLALATTDVRGKRGPHRAVSALLRRPAG